MVRGKAKLFGPKLYEVVQNFDAVISLGDKK